MSCWWVWFFRLMYWMYSVALSRICAREACLTEFCQQKFQRAMEQCCSVYLFRLNISHTKTLIQRPQCYICRNYSREKKQISSMLLHHYTCRLNYATACCISVFNLNDLSITSTIDTFISLSVQLLGDYTAKRLWKWFSKTMSHSPTSNCNIKLTLYWTFVTHG